jgi:hypothetical protein
MRNTRRPARELAAERDGRRCLRCPSRGLCRRPATAVAASTDHHGSRLVLFGASSGHGAAIYRSFLRTCTRVHAARTSISRSNSAVGSAFVPVVSTLTPHTSAPAGHPLHDAKSRVGHSGHLFGVARRERHQLCSRRARSQAPADLSPLDAHARRPPTTRRQLAPRRGDHERARVRRPQS